MYYDVLVIGGGIAGMEAAISLGDMGYKVLLAEKEPSIGGKMILLSKVFPTLDCASCISTPKMAGASNHPNIDLNVFSEVRGIRKNGDGSFGATLENKSAFVDFNLCTGCQECEKVCSVTVPDEYNFGLVSRKAAHIVFPQAVPKKAVIDREGTSPCTYHCPADIKANGYISLARQGAFEEAFKLVLEDAPLVGSLGKACYAPCEKECTRAETGGAPQIRMIKRFLADYYYERHPEPEYGPPEKKTGKRVAVVGSGPAGLGAAYFLARDGHEVRIFEERGIAGGMLRSEIPRFRLPKETVDRDIKNVTALGVAIETGAKIGSVLELKKRGYDAVFISIGADLSRTMDIEGESSEGVMSGTRFLYDVTHGREYDLAGKVVAVVGGGNVAIDVARSAVRLGAAKVMIVYRRAREEMPASREEIAGAEEEGVAILDRLGPSRIVAAGGRVSGLETVRNISAPGNGRKNPPRFDPDTKKILPCDIVFTAVGQESRSGFLGGDGIELTRTGAVAADPDTMMTSVEGIFAGGEAVTGPSMIVEAIGQGKRAAFFMNRYLNGEPFEGAVYDKRIAPVGKERVLARQERYRAHHLVDIRELPTSERKVGFEEVELPLTMQEVLDSSENCLNCGVCCECGRCVKACQAGAIDLGMKPRTREIEAGSVVVATGFGLFPAHLIERYGYGRHHNVITAMQMDRIIAPTRPYNHLLRPSDGKVPENIAYVLCAGSRDVTMDNRICSRVCCMYSIKQAQLLLGALPVADVTIYYIDIRAFGKGYEEFYEQSKGMGIRFVKGKVAKIDEGENGNLLVRYEDVDGGAEVRETEHDLVVLSTGFIPNPDFTRFFAPGLLEADEHLFVSEPQEHINPGRTSIEGVFVAGAATGPMDIPDTILHSGAAAAQAASWLEKRRNCR